MIFSVVPNSAAVERIFSHFGIVHSKLRNRISPEKVRKTVLIKAAIAEQYNVASTRKRRFGDVDESDDDGGSDDVDRPRDSLAATPTPAIDMLAPTTPTTGDGTEPEDSPYHVIPHSHQFQALAADLVNSVNQLEADPDTEEPPSDSTTLADLFCYPSTTNSPSLSILTDFWRYGENGLEKEATYHDFTHVDTALED